LTCRPQDDHAAYLKYAAAVYGGRKATRTCPRRPVDGGRFAVSTSAISFGLSLLVRVNAMKIKNPGVRPGREWWVTPGQNRPCMKTIVREGLSPDAESTWATYFLP